MEENKRPEFGTKETGMFVPDGFFADFQKNLEMKIDEMEAQKIGVETVEEEPMIGKQKRFTLRQWSIAASICVLLGLIPFAWNMFKTEPTVSEEEEFIAEVVTEDLDSEEIMVSTISDMDIYEYFYADL